VHSELFKLEVVTWPWIEMLFPLLQIGHTGDHEASYSVGTDGPLPGVNAAWA